MVKRRWGMLASIAAAQQRAETRAALVKSERGSRLIANYLVRSERGSR